MEAEKGRGKEGRKRETEEEEGGSGRRGRRK